MTTRTLACLTRNARLIDWQLGYFHEMEGLAGFEVFPDVHNGEAMEASRESSPLLRSVLKDVQQFIFEATLCAMLFEGHSTEEDVLATINDELRHSISFNALSRIVEAAAAHCREEYFEENPERTAPTPLRPPEATSIEVATPDLRRIESKLSELKADLQDQLTSVQAVQMAHQQELERIARKPSDYDFVLREKLGAIYALLLPSTQGFLQEGEWRHEQPLGPPGYGSATINFAQAFENEFRSRVAEQVARELARRFGPRYPPEKPGGISSREAPFVVGDGLNPQLTLGSYSWYVRNDPEVGKVVIGLGLELHKLKEALCDLTPFRNRAGHPQSATSSKGSGEVRRPISPMDAEKVREMILGSPEHFQSPVPFHGK